MKKGWLRMMLLAAVAVAVCACNSKNEPEAKQKVDFNKLVGSWSVASYTVKFVNLDESKVVKDIALSDGSFVVTKQTEDGETYFYYTDNFVNENRTEYTGRVETNDDYIELRNRSGFLRDDGADTFEYKVAFPSDKKMTWSYEWTGKRYVDGVTYQEKRSIHAEFNKK